MIIHIKKEQSFNIFFFYFQYDEWHGYLYYSIDIRYIYLYLIRFMNNVDSWTTRFMKVPLCFGWYVMFSTCISQHSPLDETSHWYIWKCPYYLIKNLKLKKSSGTKTDQMGKWVQCTKSIWYMLPLKIIILILHFMILIHMQTKVCTLTL